MAGTHADAVRWVEEGSKLLLDAVTGLDDDGFGGPTLLPGWTRRHLVAHVAANADALLNLVRWAATGRRTPMYATAEERAAGIERGTRMSADELLAWLRASHERLGLAMDVLTEEQWSRQVVTAQGRTVPATEIPWLRAREVCVHAVDLDRDIGFGDLPTDFLEALVADIVVKRGGVPAVDGTLPEITAWLAGRPHALTEAPDLGPWL
jgi:maleylpyruvate isomerase